VYADADIYIIDDCLSALDAYVGKAVMDEVFMGHLKDRTKIMVTHHLHHMHHIDKVYLMKDAQIVAQGTYEEVKKTKEFKEYS
jgi:ABC-type transport system involved in cytochrome bd biosynthesis fused ATPase/permease subunit